MATHGRQLLAHVAQQPPHICVVDIQMPDMDGFEVVAALGAEPPHVRCVVLVPGYEVLPVQLLYHQGASACLCKTMTTPARLLDTLQEVHSSGYSVPTEVRKLLPQLRPGKPPRMRHDMLHRLITYARHCCTDKTYAEIASQMG